MEEYRRVWRFKSNYGLNEKEINVTGGKYKYFSSNRNRLKAIDDFMSLLQDVYDKELCKHCVNPTTIKILEGDVGLYASDLIKNQFSLDLHGFTYKPATEVVTKYISLIEKHKLPSYRIIVGKSGNSMFKAVQDCIKGKSAHYVDGYDKDIFQKEITADTSRCDGHYDFKFKGGDTALWPVYDPYIYDDAYKERKDKYDAETVRRSAARQQANTPTSSSGRVATQTRSHQSPKAQTGGGLFSSIGGFIKGAAEGFGDWLDKTAESAKRERERIACQQQRFNAKYESQQGLISKIYLVFKKVYCWGNYYMFLIFVPIYLIQSFIQDFYEFEFMRIALRELRNNWQYIVGFYGLTLVLGWMFEKHEKKKFYSKVPKVIRHEVEFKFFDTGLTDHIF